MPSQAEAGNELIGQRVLAVCASGSSYPFGPLIHTTVSIDESCPASFRFVKPDGRIYGFDSVRGYERYSFSSHQLMTVEREQWALPVFPKDRFSIFVTGDMDCGRFGDPSLQTVCSFGQRFLDAIQADLPDLFRTLLRRNGQNLP